MEIIDVEVDEFGRKLPQLNKDVIRYCREMVFIRFRQTGTEAEEEYFAQVESAISLIKKTIYPPTLCVHEDSPSLMEVEEIVMLALNKKEKTVLRYAVFEAIARLGYRIKEMPYDDLSFYLVGCDRVRLKELKNAARVKWSSSTSTGDVCKQ